MATCKACGEEIRFIQTPAGKYLPVDADSLKLHTLEPGLVVVTEEGQVIKGIQSGRPSLYGYTPHWATCTHPDQFRRDK